MVELKKEQTELHEYMPTTKLRRFVEALLSQDVMGNKEKAARLSGVDKGTFYWHLKNHPEFAAWYKQQCAQIFMPHVPATAYSILKAGLQGDMKAAFKIMEHAGIFTPDQGEGVKVNVYPTGNYVIQDKVPDGDENNTDVYADQGVRGAVSRLPF